jgi:hypothetical protein
MPTVKDALYLSGDLFLPKSVRTVLEQYHIGSDTSLVYVTNWTLMHFLSGLFLGWILTTYFPKLSYYAMGFYIHSAWELWQILVKNTPYWTPRGLIDIGTDTAFTMAGMVVYKALTRAK